ncbi:MAG TPA: response regulator, partial [Nitrospiraceae bacterium]|nr:response regulator [Nitrospiraceae bacterium]
MTEDWGVILVVDDDAEMRELVHDVLKGRGHQVSTAGGGEEALKLLAEQDCAVVVTDLRMKGMQGTELLAEIQRLYPDIGVILMTAFGSVDNAVEAMKRGASDYLTKPVEPARLRTMLANLARTRDLLPQIHVLRG